MNARTGTASRKHMHWMDNLRTVTIFLVVLYHIGGVYEASGFWGYFWIVDDPDTMVWVGIMGIVFDVFVMSLLFLVSGYLAPASLASRTPARFLVSKFRRLMVPWLLAVFTLIPLYRVIFLWSRGLPQEHWTAYFHFTSPNSQNWLWFLPVLFGFNLVYLLLARSRLKWPALKPGAAITLALLAGFAYSYIVGGFAGLRSWTLTPLLDFENERLLVYFLCFALGVLFYHRGVFEGKPRGRKMYWIVNATAWIPLNLHIAVRLVPFFIGEGFEVTPLYRALWWVTFNASLLCMLYLMIETFRRYLDRTGPVWSALSRSSYGVYILHVVLIGVFGTLLMKAGLPLYVKYPALIVLTWGGANALVLAYKSVRARLGRSLAARPVIRRRAA